MPVSPLFAAWAGATVLAALSIAIAEIAVPLFVALIMGGPAWLAAKTARKEALTVSGLIFERLDRIENALNSNTKFRLQEQAVRRAEVEHLHEKVDEHTSDVEDDEDEPHHNGSDDGSGDDVPEPTLF